MMKHTTFWLLIAVLTALCGTSWSATLILRNGKKLSGDVVSKTDEHVVLKTPAGLVTQQWRACTPATIKALHPALYNRLLKEAEARKKKHEEEMAAKGFAKVGDKWLPKDQALPLLLAKVRLGVVVSESVGKFERTDRGDGSIDKNYKRESRGVLRVKLDDLDPAQRYTLRTKFICYVDEPYSDNDRAITKDNERSESISGSAAPHSNISPNPTSNLKKFSPAAGVLPTAAANAKLMPALKAGTFKSGSMIPSSTPAPVPARKNFIMSVKCNLLSRSHYAQS